MFDYDRSANVKTAMQGSLWAAINTVFKPFVETLANDMVRALPAGWQLKDVVGGAMNQISAGARFLNPEAKAEIGLSLNLGKDLQVVGFAALEVDRRMKSNLKISFDSFSSPEVVARHVAGELNKLFAADATFTRLY